MFPLSLSIKGGMIPLISPFLGLGIGIAVRFSGIERREYDDGTADEREIGTGTKGFVLLGGGVEVKLPKLRLVPSFTVNISGTGDKGEPDYTEEKDYDISVGCYYAP